MPEATGELYPKSYLPPPPTDLGSGGFAPTDTTAIPIAEFREGLAPPPSAEAFPSGYPTYSPPTPQPAPPGPAPSASQWFTDYHRPYLEQPGQEPAAGGTASSPTPGAAAPAPAPWPTGYPAAAASEPPSAPYDLTRSGAVGSGFAPADTTAIPIAAYREALDKGVPYVPPTPLAATPRDQAMPPPALPVPPAVPAYPDPAATQPASPWAYPDGAPPEPTTGALPLRQQPQVDAGGGFSTTDTSAIPIGFLPPTSVLPTTTSAASATSTIADTAAVTGPSGPSGRDEPGTTGPADTAGGDDATAGGAATAGPTATPGRAGTGVSVSPAPTTPVSRRAARRARERSRRFGLVAAACVIVAATVGGLLLGLFTFGGREDPGPASETVAGIDAPSATRSYPFPVFVLTRRGTPGAPAGGGEAASPAPTASPGPGEAFGSAIGGAAHPANDWGQDDAAAPPAATPTGAPGG
ncbi:MAG: hypothetical protein IRZ08_00605 [Frankia sp.]|nr:hypothetical protein [Frankia sp.]